MPGADPQTRNSIRVLVDLRRGRARELTAAELRAATVAAQRDRERAGVTARGGQRPAPDC